MPSRKKFIITVFFLIVCAVWSSPLDAKEKYNWFWFLYEKDAVSVYPSTLITPFYFTSKNGETRYTASLPPFIFYKYENKRSVSRYWLLGFVNDIDYTHSNGVEDYDFMAFPLTAYGTSPDTRDKYLFVWPVGGVIKGKLGLDYLHSWIYPGVALFFLYPPKSLVYIPLYLLACIVPVYETYGKGDYSARSILWPLIQWGGSPDRSEFRILPFYAHNTKTNYYDNYSYLMIFNFNKTFYKDGRELDTKMAFPFIARRWMNDESAEASSLFWPFFSWGYSKRQGSFEINFPWPLVMYQYSESPWVRKKIFFPIYGHIQYERDDTEFITPLWFTMKRDNDTFSSEYYFAAIIVWYFTRDYKRNQSAYYGNKWSYFKIWPLMRYESNDRGDVHFNMLSILPFRDPAGYEKIYDPLWSLVEYHNERGFRRFGLFMRTYYQCWDDSLFKSRVPLLFSYESRNGRVKECLFLFSMFGFERDKKGSYLRIAWIPITVGDGGEDFDDSDTPDVESEKLGLETIPQYTAYSDMSSCTLGSSHF
jgi:hypothetical protein